MVHKRRGGSAAPEKHNNNDNYDNDTTIKEGEATTSPETSESKTTTHTHSRRAGLKTDTKVDTTTLQPVYRKPERGSRGILFVLCLLILLLGIALIGSLLHISFALNRQIDFQFSDWVFSSAQADIHCSNENIRDRVGLGDTLMYRYTADHLGVADDWQSLLAKRNSKGFNDPSTKFRGYSCDWVSARLNVGDYGASKATPVVAGQWIYVGTDTGSLLKISRVDGKVLADYKCRSSVKGIHGSPAVDEDNVYIGAYDGYLYAVNRETHTLAWDSGLGNWIGASPTLYEDNIYVGVEVNGPAGYLVGVDKRTGKEIFRSNRLSDYCHSTPTVDLDTGLIFMGDNSGRLSCWDLKGYKQKQEKDNEKEKEKEIETQQPQQQHTQHTQQQNGHTQTVRKNVAPLWVFSMGKGADVKSTPAVYGDLVYMTSWNSYIYALNKYTGMEVWRFQFEKGSMSSPSIDPVRGLIVVGSFDRYVYCLDSQTGELKWKVSTDGGIMSSASILSEQGIAIIGSGRRDEFVSSTPENNSIMENSPGKPGVYIIDLNSGEVLQILYLRSRLTGVPVAVGPFVYVFDHFGYLYSFSQESND